MCFLVCWDNDIAVLFVSMWCTRVLSKHLRSGHKAEAAGVERKLVENENDFSRGKTSLVSRVSSFFVICCCFFCFGDLLSSCNSLFLHVLFQSSSCFSFVFFLVLLILVNVLRDSERNHNANL